MMTQSSLPPFRIKGKALLPIVQGGMGIGISAHRLAGHVAKLGAMGTIASGDLRWLHPDLLESAGRDKERIKAVNLVALDREVRGALEISGGEGLIAVNVMRAVSQYADYVRQACSSGAGAIVMGAGLPLDLPDLTAEFPSVALIPILSDVRGVNVVLKKWLRKDRLPDAIVIEHPFYAGGHLGAAHLEDLDDPRFDFETVLPGILALYKSLGIEREQVPLIAAGGINTHAKLKAVLDLGASAAQVGTPFAVTEECDAHANFKRVLAEAQPEDIVTFMSVAGLPARAVRTPWLENYLERLDALQDAANSNRGCAMNWDCLLSCGLRDGNPKAGQFCIDAQLAAALRGDRQHGLFFRGSESVPFGSAIRPLSDLVEYMLNGTMPELVDPTGSGIAVNNCTPVGS